jgi:hypothetical protein
VKEGSNWLALAFPSNVPDDEIKRWCKLGVGDMIRVGTAGVGGFTDYVTVLETVDADELVNTLTTDWQIRALDPASNATTITPLYPSASGYHQMIGQVYQYATHLEASNVLPRLNMLKVGTYDTVTGWSGLKIGSLRCVRINYVIDASTIDSTLHTDTNFGSTSTAANRVTDATRGEVSVYYPTSIPASTLTDIREYAGADRREMFYYPCYRQREWVDANSSTTTSLRLQMPTNIKKIRAIKLMGYSMVHKRAVGTQQQHERKEDDWFALRIKELRSNNTLLSNNRFADGALHILHTGNQSSSSAGSVELYSFEPAGLACASFSPTNLPSITIEIVDRLGQEAHFGRMHLWLKVLVTKG